MASEKKMTGKRISKLERKADEKDPLAPKISADIIEKRFEKKLKKYRDDPKMQFK